MATHDREKQGDMPDDQSIAFFMSRVTAHGAVDRVRRRQDNDQIFLVERDSDTLIVYLSDLYTIGIADYFNILRDHPAVNCIVTASGYNSYTQDAKAAAVEAEVGLFKIGEFLGALHRSNFREYTPPPPEQGDQPRRRRR